MPMDQAARAAKKRAERLAATLGVTLEVAQDSRRYEVLANAPDGRRWLSGAHQNVSSIFKGPWSYDEAWTDTFDRMSAEGLEDCPADCDCREDVAAESVR